MVSQSYSNGTPIVFKWYSNLLSKVFRWHFQWYSNGIPMVFQCISQFPMVFQWNSYGVPMVFQWYPNGIPMVFQDMETVTQFITDLFPTTSLFGEEPNSCSCYSLQLFLNSGFGCFSRKMYIF